MRGAMRAGCACVAFLARFFGMSLAKGAEGRKAPKKCRCEPLNNENKSLHGSLHEVILHYSCVCGKDEFCMFYLYFVSITFFLSKCNFRFKCAFDRLSAVKRN